MLISYLCISNMENRNSSVFKKEYDDFRGVSVLALESIFSAIEGCLGYKMNKERAWCGQVMELDGQY